MLGNMNKIWQDIVGLKKVWPYLRAQKRLVLFASLLIPVISLISMSLPIVLKKTIDEGISGSNFQWLIWGCGMYFGLVVLEYVVRAGQSYTTSLSVHRMIKDMRSHLFSHVMHLSARFHDKNMSGALVTRATSDFDNLSESLNMGVLTSIVDFFVLAGAVVGIFLLNWKLALITLAILPLVGIIVTQFSRGLKRSMLKARAKIATLNAYNQECFYGNSTIKLLVAEEASTKRFDKMSDEYRDAQMESVVLDALMFSVLDGIASITIGVVLWFAVGLVTGEQSALSAGLMVAFVAYIQNLFEPLKQLGNKMAMLQGAFTALDRIFGLLDTKDFVGGEEKLQSLKGHLQFSRVSFRYNQEPDSPWILKNISFELPAGKSVAIVGATGSGKSTMVKLAAKLYGGYEGMITIDGKDLSRIDGTSLRERMAIVPQDIVLFDGTVSFNISLGMPHISQTDIEKAARLVGAHQFIEQLPGGYDFVVSEQGKNLSYGQSQLIAFARAVAKEPGLIILDEATSSVDPQAEAAIQKAIQTILHGRSVIVIAHRLSTIRQCDEILVMQRGEILERGTHDELLQKQGAYYRLARSMKEEEAETAFL